VSTPAAAPLIDLLSAARMSTYRHYTASDDDALALYRWNILAAGAASETLGLVEVAVRNAIDRELRLWNAANPNAHGRQFYASQNVLWNQALNRAFPGQGSPTTVFVWVDRMLSLRNRVAHAEPLITVDLIAFHREAARLLSAIDPALGSWGAGISRIPEIAKRKPHLQNI